MSLFRRRPKPTTAPAVDLDVARRAAEAVNRGDIDEADRIVNATSDPQAHAFEAFRFIDVED
ncbi:hypothetical protein GCM10010348_78950 [Streptomyces anthocyanicus]|uniref:hypothetical protein n=1 Tax=Streptomyces anthocyanicus TaxID=68174 RepID=UPI001873915F|nr:hypothetical protein [Streptomyces anthocyanicus]GHC39804.1 hypothetical protein GCM10010348_78950 [Streptomyces anthocyanicus]